jgi:hypothetical protein
MNETVDAVDSIRSRLDQLASELREWEQLGRETATDEG